MSITFHRTFSLSRASIAKVMQVAIEKQNFTKKDLASRTDLGTVYQEAMPRYAQRAGLLDSKNQITAFGRFVVAHDPRLDKVETQWLMHYHLAAPHRPTAFWHTLVSRHFVPGNVLSATQLRDSLTDMLHREAGKSPELRSVTSTITVFTGTYLKNDGLGALGVLEETKGSDYRVLTPTPPTPAVLGYALADTWEARYGGRLTINLDDLTGADFAGLFLLGEIGLTERLTLLRQEGMIDLHRTAHPYQVLLLQPSLERALERVYISEH